MGLNTVAIILNDHLHDLARDPEAGAKIASAIAHASRDAFCQAPGVSVLPSQHADTVQIVAVGGNRLWNLGYGHWKDTDEDLLRKLADQLGFRVVRKAKRKEA